MTSQLIGSLIQRDARVTWAVYPDHMAVEAMPFWRGCACLQFAEQRLGVSAEDDDRYVAGRRQQLEALGDGLCLSPHTGQSQLARSSDGLEVALVVQHTAPPCLGLPLID